VSGAGEQQRTAGSGQRGEEVREVKEGGRRGNQGRQVLMAGLGLAGEIGSTDHLNRSLAVGRERWVREGERCTRGRDIVRDNVRRRKRGDEHRGRCGCG
jgi:hypothetical protein